MDHNEIALSPAVAAEYPITVIDHNAVVLSPAVAAEYPITVIDHNEVAISPAGGGRMSDYSGCTDGGGLSIHLLRGWP
jgi:hypothetical protein